MNIVGFIPCRMASSRYPGKPLVPILGVPMVEHIYRRAKMSRQMNSLYIATCDEEIKSASVEFEGKVIMTKDTHERATDRIAEALKKVEEQEGRKIDIAVMIQGDEPLVTPEMIDEAIKPILDSGDIKITNLMAQIKTKEEQDDRNAIKVVVDLNNFALYFSREAIPTRIRSKGQVKFLKQVCIMAFDRDFLLEYNEMPQTPLEMAESVDMLRIIEHGKKIKMVETSYDTYSVDTPKDKAKVEEVMKMDPLFQLYKKVYR